LNTSRRTRGEAPTSGEQRAAVPARVRDIGGVVRAPRSRTAPSRVAYALALASTLACTSAPDPATTASPAPVLLLREGATVSGEVLPGHPHVFPLPLEEGTYFEIHIDRPRSELNACVFEPGAPADADPEAAYVSGEVSAAPPGQEVWEVARTPGTHQLRIEAAQGTPARYRVTLTALRPATERDWSRHKGLELYLDAARLKMEGKGEEAVAVVLHARELFRRGEYVRGIAATHGLQGRVLQAQKRWDEARDEYRAAEESWARAGDQSSVAGTLVVLADLERRSTHWLQARNYLDRALEIARESRALRAEANALSQYCALSIDDGTYEQGKELCRRALEVQTELGHFHEAVGALINLGTIYRYRGEFDSARAYFLRAQDILKQHPDRRLEATAQNETAFLLDMEGEYLEALAHYQSALESYDALDEVSYSGTVLFNMGTIHQRLGELDETLVFYKQALERMDEADDPLARIHVLHGLGWFYVKHGKLEEAEALLNEALEVAKAANSPPLLAASLERIGELQVAADRPREALGVLDKALELYRSTGSRWREPSVLLELAAAHAALGDDARALELLFDAAGIYEQIGRRAGIAESYYRIAQLQRNTGELESARESIQQAVAVGDSLRRQVGSEELRTLFSETTRPYYELYIEILMDQHRLFPYGGHDAEALRESERSRARSLLEVLPEADLDLGDEVPEQLRAERTSIQHRLNAKEIERQHLLKSGYAEDNALFGMKLDLEELLTRLQEVEYRIRRASPRYAALTRPEPVTVGEIQRSLLDSETALLEYSLGEERSFLWVLTDGAFKSYDLPGRARIEDAARCAHWLITAYGNPPDPEDLDEETTSCLGEGAGRYWAGPSQATALDLRVHRRETIRAAFERRAESLSQVLLAQPADDGLLRFRLAVVSDGALEYVPFAALPSPHNGSDPLVESHEIVRLPSASVLAFQRGHPPAPNHAARALAIVADPIYSPADPRLGKAHGPDGETDSSAIRGTTAPIPELARLDFSRREAQAIAALAPSSRTRLLEDLDANRDAVIGGALSGARYVHFATHGVIDTQYPQLSSLVLSLVNRNGNPDPDGYLRLHDIYALDLDDADLVVLSACDTALGREIRGEGLVGLTRGFLYAGAERVVASLWQVQDRATADLMAHFYRGLLQEERSPADALRQAQLETLTSSEGDYSFPYYWAGFVLQGEWR
jgi:CHAT domain-containing protein/tetratricopeptide (TPR) repeat protein